MKVRNALSAAALLLGAVALTTCSHSGSGSRAPSSAISANDLSLEHILGQEDPRAEAKAFVGRLLTVHLRAHDWMLETDRAFAEASGPVDLFSLPSYRKLLVARPLMEHVQHQIASFYGDAVRLAGAEAGNEGRANGAREVIAGVHEAIVHAHHNPAERVLLNDLIRALRAARGGKPHPALVPLEGEALSSAAAAATSQIRGAIEALPASDEMKAAIESRERELVRELEKSPDRDPQSLNVFPSPGRNGNMDGFTFPRGTWALTFDDGPHPEITEGDLANLVAAGTKATFFWLAKNVLLYPEVIKRVQAAGMPVENHSWSHPQLSSARDLARLGTNLEREINQSTAAETRAYGARPRFFRCPYGAGANDPVIRGMIAKLGMIHVLWNVDSLDWKDPNPATVQARVEQQMRVNGRGIILFHDIHSPALKVVPSLIAKYRGQVRWVSIPQIVDELNGGAPLPSQPPQQ